MVQEAETPVIELEFVSCGTCDTLFIASERRQTCPACGGEAVGPYLEFIVTPEGLRLKNGAVAIASSPPAHPEPVEGPAAAAAEETPAAGAAVAPDVGSDPLDVFTPLAAEFLRRGEISEAELSELLQRLGADPETATTTVGRLAAVRETVEWLRPAAQEPQEEAAAEEPPAPAADSAAGSEAGHEGPETPS